jgi:hypothetical protein
LSICQQPCEEIALNTVISHNRQLHYPPVDIDRLLNEVSGDKTYALPVSFLLSSVVDFDY